MTPQDPSDGDFQGDTHQVVQPPSVVDPQAHSGSPDELTWYRVHRATPFIRGWIVIVAVLYSVIQSAPEEVLTDGFEISEFLIPLAIAGGAALVWMGYGWLAWRRMRYAWNREAVFMNSGVLFRQERKVRLDRIQTIHMTRPLLARFVGLSELDITSAAGGDSNVKLGFLSEDAAGRLRDELLDEVAAATGRYVGSPTDAPEQIGEPGPGGQVDFPGAGGELAGGVPAGQSSDMSGVDNPVPAGGAVVPPAVQSDVALPEGQGVPLAAHRMPEKVVYEVPAQRIIAAALLSFAAFITVIIVVVMVVAFAVGNAGLAFSFLPILLGFGPFVWQRLVGEYGFTAAVAHDGVRVRKGLLETNAQTIPTGRVQAVQFTQPLLWRKFGWWRASLNVAGQMTFDTMTKDTSTILPVGTRVEAMDALWLVLPDLGTSDPIALIDTALTGRGSERGFVTSPRSARWLDPWSWRRNGYVVTDRAVLIRSGFFIRRVVVVPHERIQSMALKQGPLQRRAAIASVQLHSTPGDIAPNVPHLAEEDARVLIETQSVRARQARAAADAQVDR